MKFPDSLFGILLGVTVLSSVAQSKTKPEDLSKTERYVIDQLEKGEIADVAAKFPQQERVLRASFLEGLLTNTYHPQGEIRITGAVTKSAVSLSDRTVDREFSLKRCEFQAGFNADRTVFNKSVLFDESTFGGLLKGLSAVSAKFNQSAYFRSAVFGSLTDFTAAEFPQGLDSAHAHFKAYVVFAETKGVFLDFKGAHFFAGADFSGAQIQSALMFHYAEFNDGNEDADFSEIKVKNLELSSATFWGTAQFSSAQITGRLIARGAKFLNNEMSARFAGAKLSAGALFAESLFEGPASFEEAVITGDLDLERTTFNHNANNWQPAVSLRRIVVEGTANLRVGICAGEVSLAYGKFGDLTIAGLERPSEVGTLDLSGATIHRLLTVHRVSIGTLNASMLQAEGPTRFEDVKFTRQADFTNGKFAVLHLKEVAWPTNPDFLRINGLTYSQVEAGTDEQTHSLLQDITNRAKYSAAIYADLSNYFARQGYSSEADKAFINGKRRDRARFPWWSPSWIGSILLDWLVGYGRHPWQAGVPCVFLVAVGCFLFLPSKMEPQKPEYAQRAYNAFWYSLGLFLPFVDLQSSDVWKPKRNCWFLRHYMRIHILLGWILIPILLAAISGLIK